jgi:hypothetical protein
MHTLDEYLHTYIRISFRQLIIFPLKFVLTVAGKPLVHLVTCSVLNSCRTQVKLSYDVWLR